MRTQPQDDPFQLEVRALDAEATRAIGRALGSLAAGHLERGLVVALDGDLGAGKTVFVKGIAAGLGVSSDEHVVSPTFTIARSYAAGAGRVLHHVDAYRLGGANDLESVGFEEMCGKGCVTCVEWAERVREALPDDGRLIDVSIAMEDPVEEIEPGSVPRAPRTIRLCSPGGAGAAVLCGLAAGGGR